MQIPPVRLNLNLERKIMRRHKVAVDLDGVCAEYSGWQGVDHIGLPIPGAVDFVNKLAEAYDVVIHTSRCNTANREVDYTPDQLAERVKKWLDLHEFKYHEIYTGQGKCIASAYVDDRAVSCRPQVFDEDEFDSAYEEVVALCNYTSTKEKDI